MGRSLLDTAPMALAGLQAVGATIAVYMARPWLSQIRDHLLAAGFPLETPAALVSDATREESATQRTTLAEVADLPAPQVVPTILLIGAPFGSRVSNQLTGAPSEPASVPTLSETV